FVSFGTDPLQGTTQVYVRDIPTAHTFIVSRAAGNGPPGDRSGQHPSIDADGSRVAFDSLSSNLADGANGADVQVYVAAVDTGAIRIVRRAPGATGAVGDDDSTLPSISADGNRVAFVTRAANLVSADHDHDNDIDVRDLTAATTTLADVGTDGKKDEF